MTVIRCDENCWTPVECVRCHLRKQPRGRSVPLEAANSYCNDDCPGYGELPTPPHLWSAHDSNRYYSDPQGWADHKDECPQCNDGQ